MLPDFVQASRKTPPCADANAGPCFSHRKRSRDVATQSRASPLYEVYVITYSPSGDSTTWTRGNQGRLEERPSQKNRGAVPEDLRIHPPTLCLSKRRCLEIE